MKEQEIEKFIKELDESSQDLCVFPEKQTFDCCDCYLCRVDFFNMIREQLKNA